MQLRLLTVCSTTAGNTEVPQIRIHGKWFEKLGFKANVRYLLKKSKDN